MLGEKKVKDFDFKPHKEGYAIKLPVFSFDKFPEVAKELGPENEIHWRGYLFHKRSERRVFQESIFPRETYTCLVK